MNILIIGCGHLGSRLANILNLQGHDIAVIENDPDRLDFLSNSFNGLIVQGNLFDIDVMRSAGIEGCEYVLCLSRNDNTNLMASQIARNIFHVPHIIARVLDPVKAHIYETLGVDTICSTTLSFEAVCASLFSTKLSKMVHYGSSTLEINAVPYSRSMKGKKLSEIENLYDHRLIGFLDENKKVTLYSDNQDRLISESDCLLFATVVE